MPRIRWPKQSTVALAVLATVCLFVFNGALRHTASPPAPFLGETLVHIDLKGGVPEPAFLWQFLQLVKDHGATGVLVEYEDVFPFYGHDLWRLRNGQTWDKEMIHAFVERARVIGLQVIPMLNALGDMEFLLKHEAMAGLRELPNDPQGICATSDQAADMLSDMLAQVVEMHPGITRLHLGGRQFPDLRRGLSAKRVLQTGPEVILLGYLTNITAGLRAKGIRPMLFDTEVRGWETNHLSKLREIADLMIDGQGVERHAYHVDMWRRYRTAGYGPTTLWADSAFKGHSDPMADFPALDAAKRHAEAWMAIERQHGPFAGIALTGKSRFDHFAGLCELLPTSIPSLAIALTILRHGGYTDQLHAEAAVALGFDDKDQMPLRPLLASDDFYHVTRHLLAAEPTFPASHVWMATVRLEAAKKQLHIVNRNMQAWNGKFHRERHFVNPAKLHVGLVEADSAFRALSNARTSLVASLKNVIVAADAEEYRVTHADPYVQQARRVLLEVQETLGGPLAKLSGQAAHRHPSPEHS